MWPTSIAVSKLQRTAAVRAAVALASTRGGRRSAARSRGPPRRRAGASRRGSRRRRTGRPAAPRRRRPRRRTRPGRATRRSRRTRRGSRRRSPAATGRPSACVELRRLDAVVAADEREHDRPVVGRHRHRLRRRRHVDREELGERLARLHARRLDLLRRGERARGRPARAEWRARPRCRPRSRRSRT